MPMCHVPHFDFMVPCRALLDNSLTLNLVLKWSKLQKYGGNQSTVLKLPNRDCKSCTCKGHVCTCAAMQRASSSEQVQRISYCINKLGVGDRGRGGATPSAQPKQRPIMPWDWEIPRQSAADDDIPAEEDPGGGKCS